jgi:integrase
MNTVSILPLSVRFETNSYRCEVEIASLKEESRVFPNGNGKPDGHFLRKLKAIAKKAGVEGAELHRYRKTYADTLHEEGVSLNTIFACPLN